MLKLVLNTKILQQVKQVLLVKKEPVYLLGCGNYYTESKMREAITQKKYSNPDQEERQFVVCFKSVDDIPKTTEELEKMFFDARNQEERNNAFGEIKTNDNIVDMSAIEEPKVKADKTTLKKNVEETK